QDLLQSAPVRGRKYEDALALVPGSVRPHRGFGGDIAFGFAGSSSPENVFLIDGLNTTDPSTGLIGTALHQAFLKELNVITAGYQAEYGRSTGAVLSVITKGGGNEIHGSLFGSVVPLTLTPRTIARLGE